MMRDFFGDETGAVTVDWVVMTAALVALGLAVNAIVSEGARDLSEDVETVLRSDIIKLSFDEVLANVTEGLVPDNTISAGTVFNDLDNATAFSFQMDATLAAGDSGILFEAGGTGHGTILYQHDGKLYLQSGKGNGFGATADRGEAVWDVADGSYSIEGSLDATTGLALYVDGELVSQSSFSTTKLAGGNDGIVGGGHSSISSNRGSYGQNDGHSGAGDLNIFIDHTTGGENPGS